MAQSASIDCFLRNKFNLNKERLNNNNKFKNLFLKRKLSPSYLSTQFEFVHDSYYIWQKVTQVIFWLYLNLTRTQVCILSCQGSIFLEYLAFHCQNWNVYQLINSSQKLTTFNFLLFLYFQRNFHHTVNLYCLVNFC